MTERIQNYLDNISAQSVLAKLLLPSLALFLIVMGVVYFIAGGTMMPVALIIAAILAFYLAINIGANDVANNMGPAVGSGAITIAGAILIA